jgi:hypothetical protein
MIAREVEEATARGGGGGNKRSLSSYESVLSLSLSYRLLVNPSFMYTGFYIAHCCEVNVVGFGLDFGPC